jgi:quinol monooxygenase YgiN
MEIFLFTRLHAQPGKRAEVLRTILQVQGPTRDEPGCLAHNAFQSLRDPDEFYIHSHWRDISAFERHVRAPHTVSFAQVVESLLDHPLKVALTEQLQEDLG